MVKKIIIHISKNESDKPSFKIGPLSLPRMPKVPRLGWHGLTFHFEQEQEFSVHAFRQLLTDEKARILHVIASKKPCSLYALTRLLGRDFKAVRQDIKLLEQFGLVRLQKEKAGERQRLRPIIATDKLEIALEMK